MWMGHDASWWALVLAIIALVLMVPANLAANFLTPVLKNWWAARSQAAIKKRIETLEKELSRLEHEHPLISEVADIGLQGIAMFGYLVSIALIFILYIVGTLPLRFHEPPSVSAALLSLTALILMVYTVLVILFIFVRIEAFHRDRSPGRRNVLRASIEKLKTKLH